MPPSQLKRLRTSLREQGIVGPQKSKKQKREAGKNGTWKDSRIQRNAALQSIREQFNPFEVKPTGKSKYEFTSTKNTGGKGTSSVAGRPGFTKSLGEEKRRKTLLVELQRRKKVGGITDRRFGENDPTMTPEEKALERFVMEKQRADKKKSLFDLEDEDQDGQLTHFGESLSFENSSKIDDFDEVLVSGSDGDPDDRGLDEGPRKRQRLSNENSEGLESETQPALPKTKKEVMEEVIAKSKLYKYERQQAKEDDDELREELDKGLPDIFALMRGTPRQAAQPTKVDVSQAQNVGMNPDRLALLNGKERSQADKEYDERLRQMVMDKRAQPTVRTLTEEEKLQQAAQRLKKLEETRLRRMRGEPDDSESDDAMKGQDLDGDEDEPPDENDVYGLGSGLASEQPQRNLDIEDEDDFIIDDDLVASGSDIDVSEIEQTQDSNDESDDDEEDFIGDLLSNDKAERKELAVSNGDASGHDLAFTYKCPESHEDLIQITASSGIDVLPTIVQRIRALYHPKLASENKSKLGVFAKVLVEHISYLADQPDRPPFAVLELLIRHVHSLAKTFPEEIGRVFRLQLNSMHKDRPTAPTPGDLVIFTAIGSVFPTSDHFHQVVTPAMLCMVRYLGQQIPQTLADLATGTYLCTLCLQYQRLSNRYIPEVVNYVLNTIWAILPAKTKPISGAFPHHKLPESLYLRINTTTSQVNALRLDFWDIIPTKLTADSDNQSLKLALLTTHMNLIQIMSAQWSTKSAYTEIFHPLHTTLKQISPLPLPPSTAALLRTTLRTLHITLHHSLQNRHPLRLHNHRPLAIKTSLPKFEESYNPSKHYDPDRTRAELSKLQAEHKKERKGAMRELRKDANFMAREGLREKRERDDAYEKKYRRLVAEIQGEEGREGKVYQREKERRRKSKSKGR